MDSELDHYLASADALRTSAHLDGVALTRGESFDGLTVLAPIGRGATSEVWRVHDNAHHRDLALKISVPPPIENVDTLRERFRTEARILASLDHPNIIRTWGLGEVHGVPYFTLELLRPLPEGLSPRDITALGLDLCRALDRLHAIGIVHRDLKPDNILVAPDGHYVLADLGIAALTDDKLSNFIRGADNHNPTLVDGHDRALGTPGYAAPEQMSGQRVSPAADIHALGVLFDRLFANCPPLLWRVLIRRMTSSIPTLRPQSVAAVRRALLVIRFSSIFSVLAIGALVIASATLIAQSRSSAPQPEWTQLGSEYVETVWETTNGVRDCYWHIRLPDSGNYTRGDLIRPPYAQYDSTSDTTTYHRSRLVIQGPGCFYAPHIAGADVHLISNVTLVTSSEPPTNSYFRSFFPRPIPVDPDSTSMLFPRFTIDPGSTVQKHNQLPRK